MHSLILPDCNHFSIHLKTQRADDPWVEQVCKLMAGAPPS